METLKTDQKNLLDAAAFEAQSKAQPAWLADMKAKAWEQFQALPMPARMDEAWRFANTQNLSIESFAPAKPISRSLKASILERSHLLDDVAGSLVLANDQLLDSQVDSELTAQGVRWLSLEQALAQDPELLEKTLGQHAAESLGADKFQALHTAYLRNGAFLFVPKNVQVDAPFMAYHWVSGQGSSIFPHTLVIAEEGAKAKIVDIYVSENDTDAGLLCASNHLYAHPNARVFRKSVQNVNTSSLAFQLDQIQAKRDAHVHTVALNLGSKQSRFENAVHIKEPGAEVTMHSLTVADGEQEFDQRTRQVHCAPNAYSDLLYKNVLLDKAKTIFSGLIVVEDDAQKTDAYQTNRNLMLSEQATAHSLPGLEINANDVKCSHGATTAKLGEEELFYLQSRGLHRETAQELMVFGFFEEVMERFDDDALVAKLQSWIQAKFEGRSA